MVASNSFMGTLPGQIPVTPSPVVVPAGVVGGERWRRTGIMRLGSEGSPGRHRKDHMLSELLPEHVSIGRMATALGLSSPGIRKRRNWEPCTASQRMTV